MLFVGYHTFEDAVVDAAAVLFKEFDHAVASFVVGDVVGYDNHVFAGAGAEVFYHLEM